MALPTTKGQWIAIIILALLLAVFLAIYTRFFQGEAVEVSIVNATIQPIFAYIDNSGRHGANVQVQPKRAKDGTMTAPGLDAPAGTTKTFGLAVGLFDMPTMHVLSVDATGIVDKSQASECVFSTFSFRKLEFPSFQARVKWTPQGCDPSS